MKPIYLAAIAIVACTALMTSCEKDDPVPVITITTQPTAPAAQTEGDIDGTLTVTATATEGVRLTYQWYGNTSASNTGGTAISGATSASYTFPADLKAGTYYYFCEIGADGAESVRTGAITVVIAGKPEPPAPVISITTQPEPPATLTEGSIPADTKLEVAASATQDAALQYQWYTYDKANDQVFEAISGATSASYTLPTDLAVGEHWYVCQITAEGAEPVQTDPVAVVVGAALIFTDDAAYDIPASTTGVAIAGIDLSGAASGGTEPYTFGATGLPAGISISAAGVISGTPTTVAEAGTATVTVTDATTPTAQSKSITIAFGAVSAPLTYSISASSLASFGSEEEGYTAPTAQTVTVTNTGTGAVTLTQPTATDYTVGMLSATELAAGETATFTVRPKADLPEGTYNEAITVSGSNNAKATVVARFSVAPATPPPPPDTTPPTVLSVTPADGVANVRTSGNIVITFSEAMNTVYAEVFLSKPGTNVTLTNPQWSNGNKTCTVSYTGLDNSTEYTLQVTGAGFCDVAGNWMVGDGIYTFTTAVAPTDEIPYPGW